MILSTRQRPHLTVPPPLASLQDRPRAGARKGMTEARSDALAAYILPVAIIYSEKVQIPLVERYTPTRATPSNPHVRHIPPDQQRWCPTGAPPPRRCPGVLVTCRKGVHLQAPPPHPRGPGRPRALNRAVEGGPARRARRETPPRPLPSVLLTCGHHPEQGWNQTKSPGCVRGLSARWSRDSRYGE